MLCMYLTGFMSKTDKTPKYPKFLVKLNSYFELFNHKAFLPFSPCWLIIRKCYEALNFYFIFSSFFC